MLATREQGVSVRRTRQCYWCKRRWDTLEVAATREDMERAYADLDRQTKAAR